MAPSKKRMLGSPEKSYKNKNTKSKKSTFLSENQILNSLLEDDDNESDFSSDDEFVVQEYDDPEDAQAPTNYELERVDDSDSDAGGGPMDLDSSDEDEDADEVEPTATGQDDEATPTSLGTAIESRLTRSASTNASTTASTTNEPPPTPSTSRDTTDSLADTPTSR